MGENTWPGDKKNAQQEDNNRRKSVLIVLWARQNGLQINSPGSYPWGSVICTVPSFYNVILDIVPQN